MGDLILGWYDKLNKEEGERLLSEEQKILFNIIKENNHGWDYAIEKICGEKNIEFKNNYKRLLELKMINIDNRKISIIVEEEINFNDM